jgi:hypothetical protein
MRFSLKTIQFPILAGWVFLCTFAPRKSGYFRQFSGVKPELQQLKKACLPRRQASQQQINKGNEADYIKFKWQIFNSK